MEELRALIAADDYQAVKSAVLALDASLLVDPAVGPHLMALRIGLLNLEGSVPAPSSGAPAPILTPEPAA